MTIWLVHIGYSLMLMALLARDILWLRGMLVMAQGFLCSYALTNHLPGVAAWNALFVIINLIWTVLILRERRAAEIPDELKDVYEQHFAALSSTEFLKVWGMASAHQYVDAALTVEGTLPDALYFMLDGTVRIHHGDQGVVDFCRRGFIGEMSLLTGKSAVADADVLGTANLMRWPRDVLLAIKLRKPLLWTRFQSVLGNDVIEKLKNTAG